MELAVAYEQQSDEGLLSRIAQGSQEAFAEIVARYGNRVGGYLCRLTGDPESARDLSQESFLRVWRSASGFRAQCAARTWLFQIATNVFRDQARRRNRDPLAMSVEPGDDTSSWDEHLPAKGNPREILASGEREERLENAIAALSPPLRAVLLLSIREEMSYAEIGAILDLPIGTVSSRKAAAVAILRRHLREDFCRRGR